MNKQCKYFQKNGLGNLVIRKIYGHDHIRYLRCRHCGQEFSERHGSALFNTKITEEKAVSVIDHLDEGCGVRATAKLVHVSKDKVERLGRKGPKPAIFTDGENAYKQAISTQRPKRQGTTTYLPGTTRSGLHSGSQTTT